MKRGGAYRDTKMLLACGLLILFVLGGPACVEQRMSLKEANQVAVTISGRQITPPPRRIDDILKVLTPSEDTASAHGDKFRDWLHKKPPEDASDRELARFYGKRGIAVLELGQQRRSLEDLRRAYRLMKTAGFRDKEIELYAGITEMQTGNVETAIRILEEHIAHPEPLYGAHTQLVRLYMRSGDLESARRIRNQGVAYANRHSHYFNPWAIHHAAKMDFFLLHCQGKYKAAEPYARKFLEMSLITRREAPKMVGVSRNRLAWNLFNQGRFLEAELEARRRIQDGLALGGVYSQYTVYGVETLAYILLVQGRLEEAELLFRRCREILDTLGIPSSATGYAWITVGIGYTHMARGDFDGAVAVFEQVRAAMDANPTGRRMIFGRDHSILFAYLMAGKGARVDDFLAARVKMAARVRGLQSYPAAEAIALRGLGRLKAGQLAAARADFETAFPVLDENRADIRKDVLMTRRLTCLREAYLETLVRQGEAAPPARRRQAWNRAFEVMDALVGGSVRQAMGASSIRAAVTDSELADLVRREQDAGQQIAAMEATISMGLGPGSRTPGPRQALQAELAQLKAARTTLRETIEKRFTRYAELSRPRPVTIRQVQAGLKQNEAFLAFYPAQACTYAWAIPAQGAPAFARIALPRAEMARRVAVLRKALDPSPQTLGDIPEFDLALAHRLFADLFLPVKAGWQQAAALVLVTAGPLGQIPMGILPVRPVPRPAEADLRFSAYRRVPWLIRDVALTTVPSAATLVQMRQLPVAPATRRPFVGFGDPCFSPAQLSSAEDAPPSVEPLAARGAQIHVRRVRTTHRGSLDSRGLASSSLAMLERLPDTAIELRHIARTLQADPKTDLFLGPRATEARVKTMDLDDRQIVAFASHALVPGDIDGLTQPAIALTTPALADGSGDGLLTMNEILKLRLNADWVVLSACNTAAADGRGSEAVSGLGRAFFYAGTRSVLVSLWPVETTAARLLTTGLFDVHARAPGRATRAGALRQSMLALMDAAAKDPETGRVMFSYAHPLFWAPFIVVGDGGE